MQRFQSACILAVVAHAKRKVGIRSVIEEMLGDVKSDMDGKIQGLNDKIDILSTDLQAMQGQIVNVDYIESMIEQKVGSIEQKVGSVEQKVGSVE